MNQDAHVKWGNMWTAIHCGVTTWLVYAAVEMCALSIVPWFIHPSHAYHPQHAGFTFVAFAHYLVIGVLVGVMCGLVYPAIRHRVPLLAKGLPYSAIATATTLSVVLALVAALVVQTAYSPEFWLVLAIQLVFVGLLLICLGSSAWTQRLSFLANPWTVTIVMLGLPWLAGDAFLYNWSRPERWGAALSFLACLLIVSLILQRLFGSSRRTPHNDVTTTTKPVPYVFGGFVLLVLLVSCSLQQNTVVTPPPSNRSNAIASGPHIVLMTLDTVRADHLSLYGYERDTTPNLRELAKVSNLYHSAIASSDFTLSTHASIFTGVYSHQHAAHPSPGDYPVGRPLADKFDTLAEILTDDGYFTMGVIANVGYLGHGFGLTQGFQYYDHRVPVLPLNRTRPYHLREVLRNVWSRLMPQLNSRIVYRRAETINRESYHLLHKMRDNDQPFFLFVNYMDAHWPYLPPPPYDTLYPGKDPMFRTVHRNKLIEQVMRLEREVTTHERNHLVSQYDGAIAYIDDQVGKLIKQLKRLGLYENCLIVITSDHGEAFGDKHFVNHGVCVCQAQVHVPLLIKYPHQKTGKVVEGLVSTIDLMPTILAAVGRTIPEGLLGTNLLEEDPSTSRLVISESHPLSTIRDLHPRFERVERALYSGSLKLVSSTSGDQALYDLSNDYDEQHNLFNKHQSASRLTESLKNWIDATTSDSAITGHIDSQTINRLRSLGYAQ